MVQLGVMFVALVPAITMIFVRHTERVGLLLPKT